MHEPEDRSVRFHLKIGGRARTVSMSEQNVDRLTGLARTVAREPFQARAWRELAFFVLSGFAGGLGLAFVAVTMGAGIVLAIVFVGLLLMAGALRGIRGVGAWHRALARHFLDEDIAEPEPFRTRPGFLGWLGASLTDRAAWRSLGYAILKVPLVLFGVWFGLSVWIEALVGLTAPLTGSGVGGFGAMHGGLGLLAFRSPGLLHREVAFFYGLVLLLIAPWAMRLAVYIDRLAMRLLLGPDAVAARVRTLEQSRARAVEDSAATLRRIERDLHDGTQAQLVAMAMRLGQVKEKLGADLDQVDLEHVRRLVDEAHAGAKEAIVELRDLARGIHPPVLDTGLESALATLTARAAVPSQLTVDIERRPTPAIETIAYFCVAELLANVAQHARASRASVSCVQHGPWLRLVVRDDGRGGAAVNRAGSTSSGLAGLTDRVSAVDGHLSIASPVGGPSVVTVDLPCRA